MKKSLLLLLSAAMATAATARAQGTAFSYQGRLQNNGMPVNGNYDLTFTLYTTNVGGGAVAGPVTDSATAVSNGLFIATIDFGPGQFAGNNYWLDISVSPAGSNTFTDLTPRQPILPTPYAMMANTASNLLGPLPASQLTGPIAMAQLSAIVLTNTETGVTLSGAFGGDGSGLTALNPSNLSSGTAAINISGNAATATTATSAANFTGNVADTQLSANIPRLNGANNFAGAISAINVNNAFAGTFSGNGAGLTTLNPANLTAGTAAINISGNAATATTATTATTAITANSAVTAATATTAAMASNLVSGISITNVFITNSVFAGNGGGLTGLNPANLGAGTAAINISGNAATATTANNATTAASASVAATAATANLASNLVSGATISNAFVTNSTYAGNGGGLTNLNALQLSGSVPAASLTSVPAGNLTGMVPLAQLPSAVVTNTETGVTLNGTFSGTFSGLTVTNLMAASISTNGSTSGQVLISSGGVTKWANANPWLGGVPTLVTNTTLSTNAVLT
ncbi:MAG TPA: hypothetical protein VGV18_11510, partial [Verrucomicrobiae bacterium]|nr:hypothetical protein [Verrucomicrobiae bacterium]